MSERASVSVACRFRPLSDVELAHGEGAPWLFPSPDGVSVDVRDEADFAQMFTFDRVLAPTASQADVFEIVRPVVEGAFEGYNGTVLAYGQTASGKTHTMEGPDLHDADLKGVIPRCCDRVFEHVEALDPAATRVTLTASMVEIYLERIRDLVPADPEAPAKANLQVQRDPRRGVTIVGAAEHVVESREDVYVLLETGKANRATGATGMNAGSSRSHSLLVLSVSQRDVRSEVLTTGRLYLVDLAGSEKVSRTQCSGLRLDEAKKINLSLTVLAMVIKALTDSVSSHVPYRDSKLTRVLQESLGGNSRTALIINCSPSTRNRAETMATLRFGHRAKRIRNRPTVNQQRTRAELESALAAAEAQIRELEAKVAFFERRRGSALVASVSPRSSLVGGSRGGVGGSPVVPSLAERLAAEFGSGDAPQEAEPEPEPAPETADELQAALALLRRTLTSDDAQTALDAIEAELSADSTPTERLAAAVEAALGRALRRRTARALDQWRWAALRQREAVEVLGALAERTRRQRLAQAALRWRFAVAFAQAAEAANARRTRSVSNRGGGSAARWARREAVRLMARLVGSRRAAFTEWRRQTEALRTHAVRSAQGGAIRQMQKRLQVFVRANGVQQLQARRERAELRRRAAWDRWRRAAAERTRAEQAEAEQRSAAIARELGAQVHVFAVLRRKLEAAVQDGSSPVPENEAAVAVAQLRSLEAHAEELGGAPAPEPEAASEWSWAGIKASLLGGASGGSGASGAAGAAGVPGSPRSPRSPRRSEDRDRSSSAALRLEKARFESVLRLDGD